jgi:prepilin-type N-terminal cleavage/methylation domain-containing protein
MLRRFSIRDGAFTLIELLTAVSIAAVLMTITLGIQRYAQDKSARTKAEVEIRAMGVACESYKTDQGVYPRTPSSDELSSTVAETITYVKASLDLYQQLSGDSDVNGKADVSEGKVPEGKQQADPVYLEFKPSQLRMPNVQVAYIRDPWDSATRPSPYGYSTRRSVMPDDNSAGYNSTYDLWSVAKKPENPKAWITNW